MTRDDIIRLALEAGFDVNDHGEWVGDKDGKCLERFAAFVAAVKPTDEDCSSVAALVAAAEVERMKSEGWRQCAEGQRTTQFCGLLEEAVNAERERYEREVRALQFQIDELKYECRSLRARGESR